jgi:CRISPR-associated protein Csb2
LRPENDAGILPPVRLALRVAEAMRSAVMSRALGSSLTSFAPRMDRLCGHGTTTEHAHAHYLPIADAERDVLAHVDVWFAHGCRTEEFAVLAKPFRLYGIEGFSDVLEVVQCGRIPRPSGRVWHSSTPFALDRHPKVRGAGEKRLVDGPVDQMLRALERRSFPPAQIKVWPWDQATLVGPPRAKIGEFVMQRRKDAKPAQGYGATLVFNDLVEGPLVLGRLAHFGIGQFAPDAGSAEARRSDLGLEDSEAPRHLGVPIVGSSLR